MCRFSSILLLNNISCNYTVIPSIICYIWCWLLVARLFTPEIASFYEDYYMQKGVQFIKGNVMSSFECDSDKKVCI